MAWVERRVARTSQPQDACRIDLASTLGRNFLDGRLGDSFTSLKNVPCELNPFDFPKRVDSVGKYIISHGNGSVSFRLGVPALSSATELTWVNVLTIPSSEVGATRRLTGNCYANYGVNRGLSLMMDSAGVVGVIFAGSGGLTTLMGAPASLDKSEVISVVVKRDGAAAEVSLYQGGRLTNSGTGSYTPYHVWELSGAGDDRGLQTANGTRHHLMAYFAAAPSASEIKSLADNPWQIFEPETHRIWYAELTLPRIVYPNTDVVTGDWVSSTGGALYSTLDEVTPDDADYISVNSVSSCTMRLEVAAYPGMPSQALTYRASSTQGSFLTVTLSQSNTVIMTRTHQLTGLNTLYTQTLTPEEIALIGNGAIDVTLTTS